MKQELIPFGRLELINFDGHEGAFVSPAGDFCLVTFHAKPWIELQERGKRGQPLKRGRVIGRIDWGLQAESIKGHSYADCHWSREPSGIVDLGPNTGPLYPEVPDWCRTHIRLL